MSQHILKFVAETKAKEARIKASRTKKDSRYGNSSRNRDNNSRSNHFNNNRQDRQQQQLDNMTRLSNQQYHLQNDFGKPNFTTNQQSTIDKPKFSPGTLLAPPNTLMPPNMSQQAILRVPPQSLFTSFSQLELISVSGNYSQAQCSSNGPRQRNGIVRKNTTPNTSSMNGYTSDIKRTDSHAEVVAALPVMDEVSKFYPSFWFRKFEFTDAFRLGYKNFYSLEFLLHRAVKSCSYILNFR